MLDQILQLFAKHPGQFLSGEEISNQLNCSRTAVWKHIRQLRKEGYLIEAQPRNGYRFIREPERILPSRIASMLRTKRLGHELKVYESLPSTQQKAFEIAAKEEGAQEGLLIVAETQTAGKGRMGRSWLSPSGKGLWVSLVLKPSVTLQFTPQLTLLIAVAVCRVMNRMEIPASIKWPNDLLIHGKKCAGILLETSAEDERVKLAVAGIGINVNLDTDDFDEASVQRSTSLKIAAGRHIDRESLLCDILYELEQLYDLYLQKGFEPIKSLWEALSSTLQQTVTVETLSGKITGKAVGINPWGALIVETSPGECTPLYSGDLKSPF
ncbi:biotin--[acetyl-CoA-carboxylase] ligase [Marinicrinis lubricantis]|uniref:Bifunctional ligase/repressor BirA n=1 Tax=Marinicrinis lubricantis TaxID=2086470 RepID=A0ABW1ILZ6_9BACL